MTTTILLIDDEKDLLIPVKRSLKRLGCKVHTAQSGEEGWKAVTEVMYDLVVCDLVMPGIDGIELLKRIRTIDSTLPVIIMTGVGTIENAVEAMKLGAYHYITKPFKTRDLGFLAQRAIEHGQLHRKLERMDALEESNDFESMVIGNNVMIQQMLNTIEKVSVSDASVLIQGETGTGKSMFAKLIHKASSRAEKPFFTIDCGALAEQLLESELFGHVKGAFTGAHRSREGRFEAARGGDIFLDEIGDLPLITQVKLLRVLEENIIERVGDNRPVPVDVRVITATNKDLQDLVKKGLFREDFFYRINVIPVKIPPLRKRREDIPILADHFLQRMRLKSGKTIQGISNDAMKLLMIYPWPGNVRELKSAFEYAAVSCQETMIRPYHFPPHIFQEKTPPVISRTTTLSREQMKKKQLIEALEQAGGNQSEAARILGVSRVTIWNRMKRFGIDLKKQTTE